MTMPNDLWVSTWNRKTFGLRGRPMAEALRDINRVIVSGEVPEDVIIAVMDRLEHCLDYNRALKRIFRKTKGEQDNAEEGIQENATPKTDAETNFGEGRHATGSVP